MSFVAGYGRGVVGRVVEVLVSPQQLFLSERLLALVTLERLLARVSQDVALQVALRQRRVRTQLALEALLALVRLHVDLVGVAVGERFPAFLTLQVNSTKMLQ